MRRFRIGDGLPKVSFPLHYEGAPQRRLYMPEWYVKMVKPDEPMPKNYVQFHIPNDMTKYDLKEYLDEIYNVKVLNIKLEVVGYQKYQWRQPWKPGGFEWKFMDPYHIAHCYLPRGEKFEFPDFMTSSDGEKKTSKLEEVEKAAKLMKEMSKPANERNSITLFENEWLQ